MSALSFPGIREMVPDRERGLALGVIQLFTARVAVVMGGRVTKTSLRQSLQGILADMIGKGMVFDRYDFVRLDEAYGSSRWMERGKGLGGTWEYPAETFYAQAVMAGNESAAESWEEWRGRTPFLLRGARAYVGCQFEWGGQKVRCSSINDARDRIWVCPVSGEASFSITRSELAAGSAKKGGLRRPG